MQEPAHGKDNIAPIFRDRGSNKVHTNDVQGRHEPDDYQTCFWDDDAVVTFHVLVSDKIMHPVSTHLRDDGTQDWCNIHTSQLVIVEVVLWHNED